ncbi:MAG TPA: hypothetical protein VHG30_17520 [Microvirga sp.]|nr:hypothetical protein [Microvirga sp.]
MRPVETAGTIDTIVRLAEEIAQMAPECAPKAMQIAELARGLESAPDQATVREAIEAKSLDDDLSDISSQSAASEVVKALKR